MYLSPAYSSFRPHASIYIEQFTHVPIPRPYDALYNLALARSKALEEVFLKVLRKIIMNFFFLLKRNKTFSFKNYIWVFKLQQLNP